MIYDLRTHKTYHLPLRVLLLPKEENWEFRVPTFLLDYLTTHYLTTFKFLSISFLMVSTDEVVVRPSLGVFRQ